MVKFRKLFLFFLLLLIFSVSVYAVSDLPPGLLKAKEFNAQLAQDVLTNVSFFIAFLAGITTLLSPCILPLLPAYFAVTFKEKKRITKATLLFFFGFAVVFILMGLLATLTGKTLISVFKGVNWLVPLFGLLLIFFGIMIFLGKGFSGLKIKTKAADSNLGLVFLGAAFAVGWTACIGPILSGVLLMTSTYQNYATSSLLMLGYSLGIFLPLFVFSFFYDKIHLEKLRWLCREANLKMGKKTIKTNYPNMVSGILFVLLGFVFVIFRGTWVVNGLQMFGLRQYFYDWQNLFLQNIRTYEIVGLIVFVVFIVALLSILIKQVGGER